MSTSHLEGEILYNSARFRDEYPVDALLYQDLIGTANHKADQAAQARFCWVAPVDSLVDSGNTPQYQGLDGGVSAYGSLVVATVDAPQWYLFGVTGVYAPKVHADGTPYPLRVRLAGCRSVSGTGDVDFGIVVAPASKRSVQEFFGTLPGGAVKLYTGISATSPAWLTPDDGSHLLTIPAEVIEEALALAPAWPTYTDLAGDPITMPLPLLQIVPIAQTYGTAVPRLYGVAAAEYTGL